MKVTKLTPHNKLGPAPIHGKPPFKPKHRAGYKIYDKGLISEQIANQNHIRTIKYEI